MEDKKEKTEGLFKVRSYLGCLDEGIKLPTRNFLVLLRFLSPSLVFGAVVALGVAGLCGPMLTAVAEGDWAGVWLWGHALCLLWLLCLCVCWAQLSVAASCYMRTSSLGGLRLKSSGKELFGALGRACLVLGAMWGVFSLVANGVFFAASRLWHVVLLLPAVLLVLGCTLGVPYRMTVCDYLLNPQHTFVQSLARLRDGYRNWGAFFALLLCCAFLWLVIMLAGSLPFGVLLEVKYRAMQAVAMGDAADLPAAFPVLLGASAVAGAAVAGIAQWLMFFPQVFLYGSVETGRKEREHYEAEEQLYESSRKKF